MQEEIFYNTGNGDLTFTVNDLTAHTTSGFTMNIGTGVSFKEVRIGSEFGDTPWSVPPFAAPAAQAKAAAFSGGQLTNYKGTKLGFSGYFTTAPLIRLELSASRPAAAIAGSTRCYLQATRSRLRAAKRGRPRPGGGRGLR